ncbi:MAG: SCO family protein [Magnetococcales bacterium]|nr:SCO family protein [Magnetococcales bacterium]
MWRKWAFGAAALILAFMASTSSAEYFRQKESDLDPKIFRIDEQKFMGVKLDPALELLDEGGQSRSLKDMLGKPTILVWSYFTCDGSCSAVNAELLSLVSQTKVQTIGEDYQVLTISFDANDTLDSIKEFKKKLALPEPMAQSWKFFLFKDHDRIKEVTSGTGFKFFWAPQDKTFYHPNVFIFLTAEGRISRYLYALINTPKDLGLAVLESRQGKFKINETIDYAIGLCYSYNYKEGRYIFNIPMFVGLGSLFLGIFIFIGSVLFYRFRKTREEG